MLVMMQVIDIVSSTSLQIVCYQTLRIEDEMSHETAVF